MLVKNVQGKSQAVCFGGNWHVRAPDGELVNLNCQGGADLVLGLWEYIDTLEHREIKKTRRRMKREVEVEAIEEMGGTE